MPAEPPSDARAARTAAVGLIGLAAAMGIGRFAFTPLLPLMQRDGLSLTQGGWLASANYLGYLAGALASTAINPAPGRAARAGLASVALLTLAMGLAPANLVLWLLLRFGAGAASAFVLVGMSSWALARLAGQQRSELAGWVFAGVGSGIVLAGGVGLAAGVWQVVPAQAWIALGLAATAICALVWPALGRSTPDARAAVSGASTLPAASRAMLVLCYGAFGFGYIIPATFLPAFARALIDDASVFGWVWPAFGLAAAASTVLSMRLARRAAPVRVWAIGQLVMAAGVLAPAIRHDLWATLFSALAVGGTFMVVTMAGIQHARASAGSGAPRLVAAMTAAFAVGQLLGPLTIRSSASGADILPASAAASAVLLLSSAWLLWPRPQGDGTAAPSAP